MTDYLTERAERLRERNRRLAEVDALAPADVSELAEAEAHRDWPVHQPDAPEAPIPGRHWYSGCDPDRPRVNPETGVCEGCGESACRVCGRENCPDHEGD